ncbi:DUF308 domain-containing protein [Bradyrhizobium sp. TZ2]
MFVMLVVGIGLVLAGLLAIGFGIPIKEFSTGNTLIMSGVMGVCTGAILFALWIAIRELRIVARRLGAAMPEARGEGAVRPVLPPGAMLDPAPGATGFPFNRDQPAVQQANGAAPSAPPPWQDEVVLRDHPIPEPMFPEDAAPPPPAPKPKRNLLFSSTSRKERERAQARTGEPTPPDLPSSDLRPNPPDAPPAIEPAEPQPAAFDDAWPRPDRSKPDEMPAPRRGLRTPSTSTRSGGAPARNADQPAVTILKSGVVDGMAYSLYSDGSIEAQMPEGMMRFASIDELRAHLDQRP